MSDDPAMQQPRSRPTPRVPAAVRMSEALVAVLSAPVRDGWRGVWAALCAPAPAPPASPALVAALAQTLREGAPMPVAHRVGAMLAALTPPAHVGAVYAPLAAVLAAHPSNVAREGTLRALAALLADTTRTLALGPALRDAVTLCEQQVRLGVPAGWAADCVGALEDVPNTHACTASPRCTLAQRRAVGRLCSCARAHAGRARPRRQGRCR